MDLHENWIWLPGKLYPDNQTTKFSGFDRETDGNFTVCEFKKCYSYDKKIVSAHLRFSGDTTFELYINDSFHATGPASVGNDYMDKTLPTEYYAYETDLDIGSKSIDFYSVVKMSPTLICECSKGHGGFMLAASLTFEDGTVEKICTDETWLVRKNSSYLFSKLEKGVGSMVVCEGYDDLTAPDEYVFAESVPDIWHTVTAPIPVRTEEFVCPQNVHEFTVNPGENSEKELLFDKIYAGFVLVETFGDGMVCLEIDCRETDELPSSYSVVLMGNKKWRSLNLISCGKINVRCKNTSSSSVDVRIKLISTHYPAENVAVTCTSDETLNGIMNVCRHTLRICRQTHHLDSPKHCEPLCCTGDYYIETLMTAFSFGDMRLAEFDIVRTASIIEKNSGKMFHTSYSLIWVKMMYDVYMFTGNKSVLEKCQKALLMLLDLFATYIGDNGLIETPPDYMFIDWIYIDGHSLHHPPKALGQTALNMFYYVALESAQKVFCELGDRLWADLCLSKMNSLKYAINSLLFDREKGVYFEGLNTPTPNRLIGTFMPQNTNKRYYLKHSNIMAVYSGVCEKKYEKEIIRKIMNDEIKGDFQPYFAHFLFEAIFKSGLRDEYTLALAQKWEDSINECSKGLVEGFIAPEPGYGFDHSHGWGGTPLYSIPRALLGFEINKPGLKEITVSPSLLGLESATVEIPTPSGTVLCELKKGTSPVIKIPDGVDIKINIGN